MNEKLNFETYRKAFKDLLIGYSEMFPSDLKRSLDVFSFVYFCEFGGAFYV